MAFFRNLWAFIKSRKFLMNLGIYLLSICLFLWLLFRWLNWHTGHDEFVEVPDFSGVKIPEVKTFAANFGLRDTIIDSVYDSKRPHGVVVGQDPEPKTKVKHNRTIYLYVTSYKPQSVAMPDLITHVNSPRQAIQILESYGLKWDVQHEAGQNYVHKQSIPPGKVIAKGTKVIIWVGTGEGEEKVTGVPDVMGMDREEADAELAKYNLEEGSFVCPECKTSKDSSNAKVWKQDPKKGEEVSSGGSVNLFFTLDKNKIKKDTLHP